MYNNIVKKYTYIIPGLALLIPLTAFAQNNKTLKDVIAIVAGYFNVALGLLMGLAVIMFVWYIINYFIKADANRAEAGQYLMWSLIGFFVILSLWGLVNILINTFDLGTGNPSTWTGLKNLFPTN